MGRFKIVIVLIVLFYSLVGCGSPKDANKDNFKDAINKYYLKKNVIVYSGNFPETIKIDPKDPSYSLYRYEKKVKEYDALAKNGFLDVKVGAAQVRDYNFFSFGKKRKMRSVKTKTYSISSKGKQALIKDGKRTGFKVCSLRVKSIDRFTEPAQSMGATISEVKFTLESYNVEKWVNNEFLKIHSYLNKFIKDSKNSCVLVLMNDGWVHEKEAN
jgi:hypothetical protein